MALSGFLLDWHRLRIGGLICAAVLCTVGIIVLMSEWGYWWLSWQRRAVGPSPNHPFSPNRWEMQMQVQPEAQVRWVPSVLHTEQTPSTVKELNLAERGLPALPWRIPATEISQVSSLEPIIFRGPQILKSFGPIPGKMAGKLCQGKLRIS